MFHMTRRAAVPSPKSAFRRRLWLQALEDRAVPAAFTVNALTDTGAGSGNTGDLRYCIGKANTTAGLDTITITATGKITLTGTQLAISEQVNINGPGLANLTIDANKLSRIFDTSTAADGASITFSGMTLTGGQAADGGAINVGEEVVTVSGCAITGNSSTDDGGAINVQSQGTTTPARLIVDNTSISGNTAAQSGGGIYFFNSGSFLIRGSTVSNNKANTDIGGGLYFYGSATAGGTVITQSTFSGNSAAGPGGGVVLTGSAGNTGTLSVQSSTIVNNASAGAGGGIARIAGAFVIDLQSTIVSGNSSATPDISSAGTVNMKNSAVGSATGFTKSDNGGNLPFQAHANLKLTPLQPNGGNQETHLPLPGSPLIDAGYNPAGLSFDQRGDYRVIGTQADIGSCEVRYTSVINALDAGPGSLRQAVQHAMSNSANGTVTFDTVTFGSAQTITLTFEIDVAAGPFKLTGPGAGLLTISGGGTTRMFNSVLAPPVQKYAVSGVTLANGKVTGSGGAIAAGDEDWTLIDCVFSKNTATVQGGAIAFTENSASILTVDRTAFTGNSAGDAGGAVALGKGGGLTITNSTMSANSAVNSCGCIFINVGTINASGFTLANSTFSGNNGGTYGGFMSVAIVNGLMTIRNCTITGNTAASVGGLDTYQGSATIAIESTILSGNTSGNGLHDLNRNGPTVTLKNTAIGVNNGYTDNGGNVTVPFASLKLGALANNGGPTFTHLPAVDSPLVNGGSNPGSLANDQRGSGFGRARSGATDIGAIEAATNFFVTNANNSGAGSLRQAALDVSAFPGPDTITFDPTFFATAKTIFLTSGEIAITSDVTITGPGAGLATVSGNSASRVLVGVGVNLAVSGLTLANGKAFGYGGAIYLANGSLTIIDSVLSGSSASQYGGAVAVDNAGLSVLRSTFTGNTAQLGGGAIFSVATSATPTINVDSSTLSGNKATISGGGIALSGYGTVSVVNSTISGNSAGSNGGGIRAYGSFAGTLTVANSTMTQNVLTGTGIGRGISNGTGTVIVVSSVVAQNSGGDSATGDLSGVVTVNFSLIGATGNASITGANNLTGTNAAPLDAKLAALANNGGTTLTHLPANDSPVVGKGSNPNSLAYDQRGTPYIRARSGSVDIGAVEAKTSFVVLNANDSGAGSLRQAVLDANSSPGADTVTFDPAFFATAKTITLAGTEIGVTESLTVTGPGSALAAVSGDGKSRIFNVDGAGTLSVTVGGLTLTGGTTTGRGGAIFSNGENLTVQNCVLTQNFATTFGGAISVEAGGLLTIVDSRVANNSASGAGGLLAIGGAVIQRTTIANNSAAGFAGGFDALGSLTMDSSTVSGNKASGNNGGGIELEGTFASAATIRNSTISGNTANTVGGGIVLSTTFVGTLLVQNSTITSNSAVTNGGGVSRGGSSGVITLNSTIISANTSPTGPDVFTSGTANFTDCLLGSASGITTPVYSGSTTALLGKAANLGPLADNGGPTQTHALLWTSPAIGQGSNPAPALTLDQRGKPRVVGNVDIGAFELQAATKVSLVSVGDGTNQRSTVSQIKVTFDSPVIFTGAPAAAFTLTRTKDAAVVNLAAAVSGNDVTLTFTGGAAVDGKSLADGRYILGVVAEQIGADGLDGDGNGTGGDNYSLTGTPANRLFRLFGDSNGDGTVDLTDFVAFRSAYGTASSVFSSDGTGVVDLNDFVAFRGRYGAVI